MDKTYRIMPVKGHYEVHDSNGKFIVSGDTTIAVVIGGGTTAKIYYKNGSSWVAATKVYKKVNGSWVEQSDLTTVFNNSTNYLKGN